MDITYGIDEINEMVATMLPVVQLTEEDVVSFDEDFEIDESAELMEEIEDEWEIPISESVEDYMTSEEREYDFEVEEGVREMIDAVKDHVPVTAKTAKLVTSIYILKRKIQFTKNEGKRAALKAELAVKREQLAKIKQTAPPHLQKHIAKLEKKLADKDKELKEKEKEVKEIEKFVKESVDETFEESDFFIEKDNEVSPEFKRLDETRGKVGTLERKIEDIDEKLKTARKQLKETGERRYENKIKGLTKNKEKLEQKLAEVKKQVKAGEAAQKSEEQIVKGMNDTSDEDKERKNREKDIKERFNIILASMYTKMDKMQKTKNEGQKKKLQLEIANLQLKRTALEKELKGLKTESVDEFVEIGWSDEYMTEKADLDPEMKSVVDGLNGKGYKVRYASPGHTRLRKEEDKSKTGRKKGDGIYYGKLYSDARIMFDKKYDLPTAPKYWHWREVEDCSYLDITPIPYDEKDGSPDEAFSKWKENYMNSIRNYVKSLKPNRSKAVTESVDTFVNSMMDKLISEIEYSTTVESMDLSEDRLIGSKPSESHSEQLLEELTNLIS